MKKVQMNEKELNNVAGGLLGMGILIPMITEPKKTVETILDIYKKITK